MKSSSPTNARLLNEGTPLLLDPGKQNPSIPRQRQHLKRPRVREFRKKGRSRRVSGRIGVHTKVDEFDVEKLSGRLLEKLAEKEDGWNVVDHFDVIHLWKNKMGLLQGEDEIYQQHNSPTPIMDRLPLSDTEAEVDGIISTAENGVVDEHFEIPVPLREIFIFSFGTIVFWHFHSSGDEEEWFQSNIFNAFPDCYGKKHTEEEIESAQDEMAYCDGSSISNSSKFSLKRDVATLTTREGGEKLALSFAFAKSSLLTIYEERVQKTIDRNAHIPNELARHGRLHMTRTEIGKEIGIMLLVKHGINLNQSLIDTPEEFWEDDRFVSQYDKTFQYCEIEKRLELVNNRLVMIGELHQVLIEENQNHHAVLLEWIIIILILVEVFLDMLHLGFY